MTLGRSADMRRETSETRGGAWSLGPRAEVFDTASRRGRHRWTLALPAFGRHAARDATAYAIRMPGSDGVPGYDLLVIDLDGTLLGPKGVITEENIRALDRVRAAGIEIIVATGRALIESRHVLDAIRHTGLVVTAGGSMLSDGATGRTLARSVMPHDLVIDVAEALLRHDHKVLLLKDAHAVGYDYLAVGPADLDPASEWWFETMPVRVRFVHDLESDPHPDETVRAGVVAGEAELAPLALRIAADIGERGFLQHWGAVTATESTGAETHLLEVFNVDVNKWTMIAAHCADRGIDPKRVAAIGDGLNDVELVREAGLGIAMANADPRVTAVADKVTGSYRESGVASAIVRILDGEW